MDLSAVNFTLLEAFLIGVVYFLGTCEIIPISLSFTQPLFLGFVFGLAYGNVSTGMVVGATLALYYLGNIALAGGMVQDQALATCIALPLALKAGLTPQMAMVLALPFGVFGGTLDNFRRLANGVFNRRCHASVDKLDFKGLTFNGCIAPFGMAFILRVVPVFLILYFAGSGISTLMTKLPQWLSSGFNVIGGMLPALGLIMCATLIGQKKLVPFFFISFILMSLTRIGNFTFAVLAGLVAVIYVNLSKDFSNSEETNGSLFAKSAENETSLTRTVLTKHDKTMINLRVYFLHRISNSLEYLYGSSYGVALCPALRKIYAGNDEGLKAALHRHLQPYMTEMSWGQVITGAAIAMEEEIAAGNPEVTGEQITTIKSSLMGPMASFGDTINYLTIMPILHSLVIPFALMGMVWPAFWALALTIFVGAIYFPMFRVGYNTGKRSILTLMKSGTLKKVMQGAGVLGLCMMGAMSASYVKLNTNLTFILNKGMTSESKFVLQDVLNTLMPNLLATIYVSSAFAYISRGGKYIRLVLAVIAIGMVGSIIGFF